MTLRSKIVLICVSVTAVVVTVAGSSLVSLVADDLESSLDADLIAVSENFTPAVVAGLMNDVVSAQRAEELLGGNPTRGVLDNRVLFVLGAVPDVGFGRNPGFDDVQVDSRKWRRLTVRVRSQRGQISVEVFSSLEPIEARISFLRNRAIAAGVLAVLAAGILGALLARAVTGPLRRLRDGANAIHSSDDLDHRLKVGTSSSEVDEVASVLNEMLDRLDAESGRTRQSLEAARAFASDATHELRTPLTAVANNVEILLRHPELSVDERQEVLEEINERQAAVTKVLGALRDLARGELPVAGHWQVVDLAEIVEASIASMPVDDTVRIEFASEGEFILDGWPEGLGILVDNLMSNAVNHGRSLDGRANVRVVISATENHVSISVADGGLGIAATDVERLQRRYERGDSSVAGTGLGLSLIRQQVDLHAGRLTIGRSDLGGAEVTVHLMRYQGS